MKIKSLHVWRLPIYEHDVLFKVDPENQFAPLRIDLFEGNCYAKIYHPTGIIEHVNLQNVDGYSYLPDED